MKVCKYCKTLNRSAAEKCVSCGANEFKYKCENCDTEFENAAYCPTCGVRAGRTARTCPDCGEKYFTRACPTCGYTPDNKAHDAPPQAANEPAPKKKKGGFWIVLLWILFLPIMGSIAIARSRRLSKGWKIGLISAIAAITAVLMIVEGGSTPKEQEAVKHTSTTSIEATERPTATPTMEITPQPSLMPEPTQGPVAGYVNANSLNMRSGPSKDSDIVSEYEGGQVVEIVGADGDWYKVVVAGATGYMLKEYVGVGEAPEQTKRPAEAVRESEAQPEPTQSQATWEIPYEQNYHGHVYKGGSDSVSYHYESDCAGKYSHEITWDDVEKLHLNPCGTCVAK